MAKLIVLLVTLLIGCWAHGQSAGAIPQKDYDLWTRLDDELMSADGKWVAFTLSCPYGKDTLCLQQAKTKKLQKFHLGTDGKFSPDAGWFMFTSSGNTILINLASGTAASMAGTKKVAFGNAGAAVLAKDSTLSIFRSKWPAPKFIGSVRDFAFSDSGHLAIACGKGIQVLRKTDAVPFWISGSMPAERLWWDHSGTTLFYLAESGSDGKTLAAIGIRDKNHAQIETETLSRLQIALAPQSPIVPNLDATECFVWASPIKKTTLASDSLVEIWKSSSPLQYGAQREFDLIPNLPRSYRWDMQKGTLEKVAPDSLFLQRILPDRNYVLAYNPIRAGQLHLDVPETDYYLKNLSTGKLALLLTGQPTATGALMPSPTGDHIGYRGKKGWMHYDLERNTHTLVLENAIAGDASASDTGGLSSPGWTADGKYCIVHSGADFWLAGKEGTRNINMTRDAAPNIKFKLIGEMHKNLQQFSSAEIAYSNLDVDRGIFFHAYSSEMASLLYRWTQKKGLELMYRSRGKAKVCSVTDDYRTLLLREESDREPASLLLLDLATGHKKILYQSNTQYLHYGMPIVDLMPFSTVAGRRLNALLHYPASYDPQKKYPMIVYVYEMLSQNRYEYNMPTNFSPTGFAIANYTNDGYFVLQPDVRHITGNPGSSTVDCVVSAVESACKRASIDRKKIGMIGHSYGGHETALTITKTPIFAAAVAGAASSNMISDYLSINEVTGRIKFWKFESQQYRMGGDPFSSMDRYLENSPVLQAAKIVTPLLSWSGKADGTVDFRQSVEMHLALKRLGKQSILLAYPEEGHILSEPEAQSDLTKRIKAWFDSYLK